VFLVLQLHQAQGLAANEGGGVAWGGRGSRCQYESEAKEERERVVSARAGK
jgi:hypothetical protein